MLNILFGIKKGIKLKDNYIEELSLKVNNFEKIIEERSIFYNRDYSKYRKLYTQKDFFEFLINLNNFPSNFSARIGGTALPTCFI